MTRAKAVAGALLVAMCAAMAIVGVLTVFMVLAHKAKAESDTRHVTVRVAHRSCDWIGNCDVYYTYRRIRRQVYTYEPRVYGYQHRERDEDRHSDRRDYSPHCLSPVRVVGGEHATEDGAMSDVQRTWSATVRHDHGERYQDTNLAKEMATVCDRSSTNESWVGKAVEGVARNIGAEGAYKKRCVLVATPCRAQLVRDNDRRR